MEVGKEVGARQAQSLGAVNKVIRLQLHVLLFYMST